MPALLMFAYGVASYFLFVATFLYAIAFAGNLHVPRTLDTGPPSAWPEAVLVDLLLLAVFAVQHSVMARPAFKRWWTRIVPEAMERSTYVLFATLALALLLWQWRPIPTPIVWSVAHPAAEFVISVLFWLGWVVLFTATFLINHFELFGLRQVWSRLSGQPIPESEFRTPFLYRHVRHPIYLGFLLGFWATPRMTAGHLLFCVGITGYILLGVWFEERDLVAQFGDRYRLYKQQVAMLVPWPRKSAAKVPARR
jgi:protein-S-isoprenylcysteine O-methyltransferase Ste14